MVRPGLSAPVAIRAPGNLINSVATAAACLSILALGGIELAGAPGVLLFVASGGALAILNWQANVKLAARFAPLLLIPAIAILSALWSDAAQVTMRAALQLFLTMLLAILVSGNLPPRRFILMLWLVFLVLCSTAIPYAGASLQSGQPLASPFLGSKNQIGRDTYLLFASALALCFDRKLHPALRFAAAATIPMAFALGYLSQSGGGTVSFMLGLVCFPILASLTWFSPRARAILAGLAVIAFGFALLFRAQIDDSIANFRSNVLNKSESLTGRTYLWDVANNLWHDRLYLGHGYGAFWRHGNLEAEGLWRWGGIPARTGFNFHNALAEMKVDLGLLGLSALIASCLAVAALCIWRQLREPSVAGAFFTTVILVLYIRSYVESELIYPFSMMTLIWVAAAVYARREPGPDPRGKSKKAARVASRAG
jgi:exopolysaccharide production protein ExoQ